MYRKSSKVLPRASDGGNSHNKPIRVIASGATDECKFSLSLASLQNGPGRGR